MLCRAHLYPDSLKKIASDFKVDKAHFFSVGVDDAGLKKRQTLPFDTSILCRTCDARLGDYDDPFKTILLNWADNPRRRIAKVEHRLLLITTTGRIDSLYKGAIASLLRFSYSQNFPNIKLGERYEETIAAGLLRGEVLDRNRIDMRVVGTPTRYLDEHVDISRVMRSEPQLLRSEGSFIYLLELFGLIIFIKVGQKGWPSPVGSLPLRQLRSTEFELRLMDFEHSFTGRDMARLISVS